MTRKDYQLIAEAIAECQRPIKYYGQGSVAKYIADNIACHLKKDNSNFDKDRFLNACGFGEEGES